MYFEPAAEIVRHIECRLAVAAEFAAW